MSNASGNESDGRGSARAGEGATEKVVQKGTKASEGKGKAIDEGTVVGQNEGPKNKTTGMWHALTNI